MRAAGFPAICSSAPRRPTGSIPAPSPCSCRRTRMFRTGRPITAMRWLPTPRPAPSPGWRAFRRRFVLLAPRAGQRGRFSRLCQPLQQHRPAPGPIGPRRRPFGTVPAGNLRWFKPPSPTGLYTNGFNAALAVEGSPWTNSASALSHLLPNQAQLIFSGGGLASNLVFSVQLTSSNTLKWVSGPRDLASGAINRTNGLMTLTFTNTSGNKVTAFGTLLQNAFNRGGGFFSQARQTPERLSCIRSEAGFAAQTRPCARWPVRLLRMLKAVVK